MKSEFFLVINFFYHLKKKLLKNKINLKKDPKNRGGIVIQRLSTISKKKNLLKFQIDCYKLFIILLFFLLEIKQFYFYQTVLAVYQIQ